MVRGTGANAKQKVGLLRVLMILCLSASMIMGTVPYEAYAAGAEEEAYAAEEDAGKTEEKTVTGLGLGEINGGTLYPSDPSDPWDGAYVFFGKYDGKAMKYRVLSALNEARGKKYVLLDCDNVLYNAKFDGDSNIWAESDPFIESDIRKQLYSFYSVDGVFTTAERDAIIPYSNKSYEADWTGEKYPDGTYEYNELLGEDPAILLDVRSVIDDNQGYRESIDAAACRIKKDLEGKPAKWWLRTKSTVSKDGDPCVFSVEPDGSLSKNSVRDVNVGVSPAFTIMPNRVMFSSLVKEGEYKLTLQDDKLLSEPQCGFCTRDGNIVTIPYTYTEGSPTQLSVVVTKNGKWDGNEGWMRITDDEDAKLLQYAKLDTGDSLGQYGTGTFTLDPAIQGEWGKDYRVYLLAEKVNGADETDYASSPIEIRQLEVEVSQSEYTYDGFEHGLILSVIDAPYSGVVRLYGESPDSCSLNRLLIKNVSESPKMIYYMVRSNNCLTTKGSATLKINKAPLNVSAKGRIPYGAPLPGNFELVCDGLVHGEDPSVLKGTKNLKFESDYVPGSDAGRYEVRMTGELTADNYDVTLTEGALEVVRADHPDEIVSGNAAYGTEGILELKDKIEAGGTLGAVSVSEDVYEILDGTPVAADGTRIRFKLKNDPGKAGKKAKVAVSVNGAKNYLDYRITVELEVISCDHANKEFVPGSARAATCTEQGYEGDYRCPDCGALIEGKHTPIDPENHHFKKVGVVKPATALSKGETKYECSRCHTERILADIPCIEEEGKDYDDLRKDLESLSGDAAPKIEEKKDENGNVVEETIKIGGEEISKTVTDPESGKETVVSKVWIGGLSDAYTYTGAAIRPQINVYDGTRKLAEKTDYTLKYTDNKEAGTARITIRFKGNYGDAKTETVEFKINPAVLGKDVIAHETGAAEKKSAQNPVPVLTWKETGKTVPAKNFEIKYDRTVKEAGTYTATITPKNKNFEGTATVAVRIAEKNKVLSNAKVRFEPASFPYTGKPVEPKYSLIMGNATLAEGTDYRRVSLTGNTNPGTASIIFEAISGNAAGYVGSRTASFKITGKRSLKDGAISISWNGSVPYSKGGAGTKVVITDQDTGAVLKEGVDYILSYSKNKSVGTAAEVKIKGRGYYKDTVKKNYAIVKQNLAALSANASAQDQFTGKGNLKKASVTITDLDGKKLKAGTDYELGQPVTDAEGNTDAKGTVFVPVTGKGNYEGTLTASFRYMQDKSFNISKAKVLQKIPDQTYTGYEVRLSNADLTGVLSLNGKTLVPGTDLKVTGYRGNIKKGTAKVTVQGLGDYAGTKTIPFKIVQKGVDYKGALIGGTFK
ncbi:MAG: hypothetical protein K6F35_04385 [Lachnospiraceae bacterium]|nr:hypothetical protein [Lachnospiraceae bacterium]